MSDIRTETIALDSHEYIHALRKNQRYPASAALVRGHLPNLSIYIPIQVVVELNRNLNRTELEMFRDVVSICNVTWGGDQKLADRVQRFNELGAKKGDAIIVAELEAADVWWLISENRHFLVEIADLPFKVISAEEALLMIATS